MVAVLNAFRNLAHGIGRILTSLSSFTRRSRPNTLAPALWPQSVLVDSSTRAVLASSGYVGAIAFLNDATMDTLHVPTATYPHYISGLPFTAQDGSLAHWTWNGKSRKFTSTRADVLTNDLVEKSRLVMHKLRAILQIINSLSLARSSLKTGIDLQETVYMTKKIQAQHFKDSGYDENIILECPYVLQYADITGLPLRVATDDILLKAKLDDDLLAKTELLRLVYFGKIRKASRPEEIPTILEEFNREAFINAMV
jgi:hypothetical protein